MKREGDVDLQRTLERLKEFRADLNNHPFMGISLSNLPPHFWESLGESIDDLEKYLENPL